MRFRYRLVVRCCWYVFLMWNNGRSIFLTFGTIWEDCLIKYGISGNEDSSALLRPKAIAFGVWFIPNEYHLLGLRRQFVVLLLWWDKDISTSPKYSEVGNIGFVSIEDLNGHFPIVTTHWLAIVNMQ